MYYVSYDTDTKKYVLVEDCSPPSVEIQEYVGGIAVVRRFRVSPHCTFGAEV